MTAKEIIQRLDLAPLPLEGGYFRRVYTSKTTLGPTGQPAGAAIYYLLTTDSFSAIHKLSCEETYHFYLGDPVELALLDESKGKVEKISLGPDISAGETPQFTVAAGIWQGSRIQPRKVSAGFSLLGTTTTPAFTDDAFTLGQRDALISLFPKANKLISALTR